MEQKKLLSVIFGCCACVRACVCVCVCACLCVRVCVRACVRACLLGGVVKLATWGNYTRRSHGALSAREGTISRVLSSTWDTIPGILRFTMEKPVS